MPSNECTSFLQKPSLAGKLHFSLSPLCFIHIQCERQWCYWFSTYTLDPDEIRAKPMPLFPDLQDEICKYLIYEAIIKIK
jgi:hypothetical protein